MGISYTYSAFFKLSSIDWMSGSSAYVLEPFFRFPETFEYFNQSAVWIIVVIQMLALPGLLFRRSAVWIWALLTFSQLGILFLLKLEHISLPVLLFHLACFDLGWLPKKRVKA
jgi:hypothetical protein